MTDDFIKKLLESRYYESDVTYADVIAERINERIELKNNTPLFFSTLYFSIPSEKISGKDVMNLIGFMTHDDITRLDETYKKRFFRSTGNA